MVSDTDSSLFLPACSGRSPPGPDLTFSPLVSTTVVKLNTLLQRYVSAPRRLRLTPLWALNTSPESVAIDGIVRSFHMCVTGCQVLAVALLRLQRRGGLVTLASHCRSRPHTLVSLSWQTCCRAASVLVNVEHTPVPPRLPTPPPDCVSPDASSPPPPNCQGAITSLQQHFLHCLDVNV